MRSWPESNMCPPQLTVGVVVVIVVVCDIIPVLYLMHGHETDKYILMSLSEGK